MMGAILLQDTPLGFYPFEVRFTAYQQLLCPSVFAKDSSLKQHGNSCMQHSCSKLALQQH